MTDKTCPRKGTEPNCASGFRHPCRVPLCPMLPSPVQGTGFTEIEQAEIVSMAKHSLNMAELELNTYRSHVEPQNRNPDIENHYEARVDQARRIRNVFIREWRL